MRVLLVCTGNTCRSPMAEALLRQALAERGGDRIDVSSAGIGAASGAPASDGAYLVALEHGLDLSEHRSRLLDAALVESADLILAMGQSHLARAEELGGAGKTFLLGEYVGRRGAAAEVSDPFGADLEAYRVAFDDLRELVADAAERLVRESPRDQR